MLGAVFQARSISQRDLETLRSLKNAPSHRPDVLREGDTFIVFAYPLLTLIFNGFQPKKYFSPGLREKIRCWLDQVNS